MLLALFVTHRIGTEAIGRPLFDQWQRLVPATDTASAVTIVWIDDASVRGIGSWPWSRYMIARLTETIAARGARVIALDLLMPERDRQSPADFAALYPGMPAATAAEVRQLPSMDAVLAQVVGRHPVVLGRAALDAAADPDAEPLAVEAGFAGPLPKSVKHWDRALANIREIDDVALGHGLLNADPDSDGTIRRVPLVAVVAGQPTPGFALEIARIAADAETIVPVTRHSRLEAIRLGNRQLPVDADGGMRVPLAVPATRATVSALDLLDRSHPNRDIAGRIVIIGLSAAGTADVVPTPLSARAHGTEVQAAAVEAILAGRALSRPAWTRVAEPAVAILLAMLLVFGLSSLRPYTAAAIITLTCLALIVGSWIAWNSAGLLLDPVRPLLIILSAGGIALAVLFSEGRRHQQRLRRALIDQQIAASHAAGELAAARDIQLGMLPTAAALAVFAPRVEIDGLIEPARSIGGDFFDVVRVAPQRICMLVGDVTGKGVPAALFMALSTALTRSVMLRDQGDLATALGLLNDEIARDNSQDMFVTMLVALIDTDSGRIEFSGAGHEHPYRITATGKVEMLVCDGGPPLAVVPGVTFGTTTVQLNDGDCIVIISDGISEAQSPTEDVFGKTRVAAALDAWGNRGSIEGAGHALLEAVRAFEAGGEATDDVTVLALRYRSQPPVG